MNFIDKDLASIQEARILNENAIIVQKEIRDYSSDFFDRAVDIAYRSIDEKVSLLAKLYVEESNYGNYDDTETVTKQFLHKLYSELKKQTVLGEFSGGRKIGVPMGGIVLIPSPKNSLLSMINIILLALKTGNALVIATEKRVCKLTASLVDIVNEALSLRHFPEDMITCFRETCHAGVKELLQNGTLSVVINAGNKEYLEDCILSGKILYYGSTGASPVFIERSADVKEAVKDIVHSRSFNHGILPGAEQFLVVDAPIIAEVNEELLSHSCYFMKEEDEKRLIKVLTDKGCMDEEKIGKSAYELAKEAGFSVPVGTKLLVSYQEYISEVNSYTKELNVPVLVVYKETDWLNACEKCIKILTTEHDGHSLSIYSKDQEVIAQFAHKKPVGRVMVNTDTSFAAMGIHSDIYPSAILGAFTRGLGSLSGNLMPENLVYIREIVKEKEEIAPSFSENSEDYSVNDILSLFSKIIEK